MIYSFVIHTLYITVFVRLRTMFYGLLTLVCLPGLVLLLCLGLILFLVLCGFGQDNIYSTGHITMLLIYNDAYLGCSRGQNCQQTGQKPWQPRVWERLPGDSPGPYVDHSLYPNSTVYNSQTTQGSHLKQGQTIILLFLFRIMLYFQICAHIYFILGWCVLIKMTYNSMIWDTNVLSRTKLWM